jgi:hypothetical protein
MTKSNVEGVTLERGTVARGRTVSIPHPTEKRIVGRNLDGKEIVGAPLVNFGPGREVTLPADEIVSLRKLGYLIDPEQSPIPIAPGPSFSETAA